MTTGNRSTVHDISIHALREEGDASLSRVDSGGTTISIHALREEGDSPSAAKRGS